MGPVRLLAASLFLVPPVWSFPVAAQSCPLASFSAGRPLPFADTSLGGRFGVRDLDVDGRPDLIRVDATEVRTSKNLGNGSFAPPQPVALGGGNFALGDFDGDAVPDLALGRGSSLVLLLGDGALGFREAGQVFDGIFGEFLTGDFDGNGALDLGLFTGASPSLAVLLGDGRGHFQPPVLSSPFPHSRATAVDMDHDGRDDVVWSGGDFWGPHSGVVFSNGDGTFRDGYGLGGGFKTIVWVTPANVDDDGNPDLVIQTSFEALSFELSVGLTDASGRIRSTVESPGAGGRGLPHLALADFTGDGRLDFVYASEESLVVVMGDGAGGFDRPVSYPARAGPAFATDVDGDGRPDVVVGPTPISAPLWYRNTCPVPGIERTLVVPVILSTPGAAGAFWESDLTITNAGSTPAHLDLEYTPSTGGGGGTASTTIPPGTQLSGASAFELLERLGIPGSGSTPRIGTLRAHFSGLAFPHAAAMSVRTASAGAGVAYPGIEPPLAPRQTVGWLKQDAEDRSNLGLVNAGGSGDGDVTLRVTVVSTDSAAPGSVVLPDVTIPPGGFRQIDRILEAAGLRATSGAATVERVAGGAAFVVWGVVNDAVSSDGSFVAGRPADDPTGSGLVPSVVETTAYRTEVVLSNAGELTCQVRLTLSSGDVLSPQAPSLEVTLPPRSSWRTEGIVDQFRRAVGHGFPPRGGKVAGVLSVVDWTTGCDASRDVAVRVLTEQGDRGRFGVLVPATLWRYSPLGSRIVWIPDLRQDLSFRTNLALVETYGSPALYRVELFSADGRAVASRDVPVASHGWLQVDGILAQWAPGVPRAWARVTRLDSPTRPATAYAVINDGAAPGLGTGDGSIVWMEPEP